MSEAPKTKLEELEELREKKLEERAKAETAQYEKDLEARIRLEDDHGVLAAVRVVPYKPGLPTRAYVKTPSAAHYKRFTDLVNRAGDDKKSHGKKHDAIEQLARAAWVYPEAEEDRERMFEAMPGILNSIASAAATLAQGQNDEAGKD